MEISFIKKFVFLALVLLCLAAPVVLFADQMVSVDIDYIVDPAPADAYWVGGTGDWSDAANHWALTSGGTATADAMPGTSTNVYFDASSGSGTVTIDSASVSVVDLIESSADITIATSTNGITVTGNMTVANIISGATAVTFSGTGKTITGGNTATGISAPLTLGADATVFVDGANLFTISGIISGAYNLAKTGSGDLELCGANTYTGTTTINQGVIWACKVVVSSGNSSLGNATSPIVLGDATNSGILLSEELSSPIFTRGLTVNAGGGGVRNIAISALTIATGGITANGSFTITGSRAITISSIISGEGGVINTNTSSTLLSGANTFTGGLTIKAGTVSLTTSTSAGGGSGTGTITLGDTSGSVAATLQGDGRTFANPIVLNTGTTGTLTIKPSATSCIFSGGVTGTNNLVLNGSSSYTLTLSTASVNNSGTVTNSNAGTGLVTISGGIGANVTGVIQNSTTSATTISTNPITVNAGGTTLTNALGTKVLTVSGGVTGTGNLILNNNSTKAGGITLTTTAINNTGTVTNSGSGTGTVTITTTLGAAVTDFTQNSSTSQSSLSANSSAFAGTVTVTSGTLAVAGSAGALGTVAGATTVAASGTFDIQNFNYSTAEPLTLNGGTISASIGTSTFAGAINLGADSTASVAGTQLTLSGVINDPVGTYAFLKTGTGILVLSAFSGSYDGSVTIQNGTVSLTTNAFSAGGGAITLGSGTNSNSVTLKGDGRAFLNSIVLADISTYTGTATISTTGNATFAGGVSGTNNLTLTTAGANTLTLSIASINNTGTITNTGAGTGTTTISGVIGTEVTGVIQNSATSALTLSNASNTFTGLVTNSAGTLNITQNNTFSALTLAGDSTTKLTVAKTLTLTDLDSTGTAGHLANFQSSAGGSTAAVTTASAQILTDYLAVTDITATQTNIWFYGANGTASGTTTNWSDVPDTTPPVLATGVSPATLSYDNTSATVDIADVGTCTDAGLGMHATEPYQVSYSDAGTSSDADCSDNSYTITTAWGTSHNASFTGTDGHYYCIKLECKDTAANSTAYYSANNILYDITAPTITAITSVAGDASATYYDATNNSSTLVVYTASADATTCKWNTTDVAYDSMSNTCTSTTNCTLNLSGDGAKTVYMRCQDSAGNKAGSSYTLNYTIDATAPSTTDNSDTNWHVDNQTITLTPDDGTGSGIATTYYCVDTDNSCTPTTEGTSVSVTCASDSTCQKYVRYYSTDNLANAETVHASNLVKIDKTAPATVADAGSYTFGDQAALGTTVDVTLTCADAGGSGCLATLYCTDTDNTCTPITSYAPFTVSTTGTSYIRYSSTDSVSNTETTKSQTINITATPTVTPIAGGSGAIGGYFLTTPTPTPTPAVAPTPIPDQGIFSRIQQQLDALSQQAQNIANVFKPNLGQPEIQYPPIEEAVPEQPQVVFRGGTIISLKDLEKIAILPLPQAIKDLALKFPKFGETLEKVGISKPEDIKRLQVAKLIFPGLSEASGAVANLSLSKFTAKQITQIPTGFVFAKTGADNIDFNTKVSFSILGEPIKSINTIANKPLYLAVKPEVPAESVKGYIIFKSANSRSAFLDFTNKLSATLSASLLDATNIKNVNDSEKEITAKKDIVLEEFYYQDSNHDGAWEATIMSPAVDGKYEIRTKIDNTEEISMIMVVDPEGYIYRKIGSDEARIQNATVFIYWLNPVTKEYELWPAKDFQQENPQITDVTGRYAFLVPPGEYYLEVASKDYLIHKGEPFKVVEGSGVHLNIELKNKSWFWRIFSVERILLVAVVILLITIIIILLYFLKRRK